MAKSFKQHLKEAETKVKDNTDIDWDTFFDDEPKVNPIASVEKKGDVDVPKLNVANADQTRQSMASMTPTDQMRDMMGRINVPDDMMNMDHGVDEPLKLAGPEKGNDLMTLDIKPRDVPTVIHNQIANIDPNSINPTWHIVSNLPGNMSRAILQLGKAVFKSFTRTPTEDIAMIGNVGGMGPNSTRDVLGVAKWLEHYAKKVDDAKMDFGPTIQGYDADIQQYTIGGIRFMLVKDFAGNYIYSWPEKDSLTAGESPALPGTTNPHSGMKKLGSPTRSITGRK